MIAKAMVKILTIDEQSVGQRLDNFLFRELSKVPKSFVYKIIRKGEVRVNSGRKRASYKLRINDRIRIPPVSVSKEITKTISNNKIKDWIIFEDEKILVINKPAGLAVHGGSGIDFALIDFARDYCGSKDISLVHRIDRETSGCIVLAKKRNVLRQLHELFREKKVTKSYLALLSGRLKKDGVLKTYLKKNVLLSGERVVKTSETDGKEAITNFRVLGIKNNVTFTMIKIHTGRTHQIRVHSASLGAFIIGDDKYGIKEFNKGFFKDTLSKRMLLHAYQMEFILDSRLFSFVAPLDPNFENCLKYTGFSITKL